MSHFRSYATQRIKPNGGQSVPAEAAQRNDPSEATLRSFRGVMWGDSTESTCQPRRSLCVVWPAFTTRSLDDAAKIAEASVDHQ
jgi:hypothetical protein